MFNQTSLLTILVSYMALLFSLCVHEASHASAAYLLGDDTAAREGRMTLNPVAHADPVGTVLFPLLGMIFGGFFIGWAKPVPYNPARFSRNIRMKWGGAIVSSAGPASNLVLSFLALAILSFGIRPMAGDYVERFAILRMAFSGPAALMRMEYSYPQVFLLSFGAQLVLMNVLLAAFNILPLGPLDGAGVLRGFIPDRMLPAYDNFRYNRYSFLILIVLLALGVIRYMLDPVRNAIFFILTPVARLIFGA